MRELRLFLFLVVGCLLGGGCSMAFAAMGSKTASANSMGMGFNVRAPSNVAVSGFWDSVVPGMDWTYDHYSSADTKLSRSANGTVGGAPLSGTASRVVTAANIAKAGVKLAKLAGPVSLGLTLSELIWDEMSEQWMREGVPESVGSGYVYTDPNGNVVGEFESGEALCAERAKSSPGAEYQKQYDFSPSGGRIGRCWVPSMNWTANLVNAGPRSCPSGSTLDSGTGQCMVPGPDVPATDADIEDAIYVELVARGMSSDLARRLVEAGYAPDLLPGSGPSITSGPASLTGPTSTSTTSSAAGITTVTNTTNYNITYQGDTVTVNETTTTTKTNPDNTTETTTETKTPAPTTGEEPSPDVPPEQPPEFCELHPESIVCQQMDTPAEDKGDPIERTFSITPSGGFGGAGSCPADVGLDFLGQPISWSYQPACDFFSGVRPAVVAMAWVAAILIALGGYRKGD